MMTLVLEGRTVSIVKPYKEEVRKGNNGDFTSKEIFFKVACDRDYKVTRTENGKTIQEYPTDFFLVKATGELANIFNKYATATKDDGKLQSRHILIEGSLETYRKDRKVAYDKQVNIGGNLYQIKDEFTVPDTPVIIVADKIRFLDSAPQTQAQTQATSAPVVTAVAPVAPAVAPVMPAQAQVVQAPVVAPAVQTVAPVAEVPVADMTQACPY